MTRAHLLEYLSKGVRFDGRGLEDYREIEVTYEASNSAEGSARIRFGGTDVIAGVKMSVEKPYPDTPDDGTLMVNVELLPMASPEFEPGPPGIDAIELARVTDRGIRESHAIDTHKLCVEAGEKVWSVIVDVCTINAEGGLFDVFSLGALAALKNARFPKLEEGVVDYGEKTDTPLPLLKEPLGITVYKIDKYLLVDPLPEEEEEMDARLTVTTTEKGEIVAMQKGGDAALTSDEVMAMVELAVKKAPELRAKL